MRKVMSMGVLAATCFASAQGQAGDSEAIAAAVAWDAAGVARMVDDARQARERGDLMLAERLCYTTFETVDQRALESLDAYVDLLEVEHRDQAHDVREQVERLRQSKASQKLGKQPSSAYLGFSPKGALDAYADLLQSLGRADASARIRSLGAAYEQVQRAHVQRTLLFRQGKDPRGTC